MRISVVIPARNEGATLADTLLALGNGERRPDEIIVVDGTSDDDTKAIAERYKVRVLDNERSTIAAGRQIGLEAARGEVIAFTDADCVPAPSWLRLVGQSFAMEPRLDGTGGPMVLRTPRTPVEAYASSVFARIMSFSSDERRLCAKVLAGAFTGANSAFRKQAVLEAGGFHDRFGNHGEDIDLLWRLVDRGCLLVYNPALVVEHLGFPQDNIGLLRMSYRLGRASTKLAKAHDVSRVDWRQYRILCGTLLRAVRPWNRDPTASLRLLRLSSFVAGKARECFHERTWNL